MTNHSPIRRTPSYTTPRHRTVFGSMSPNLMSNSRTSIIDTQKVISPNFNVVSSDWSMSSKRFSMNMERSHSRNKSEDYLGSPKKLRRTNTNEMLDRFIPSRQTTSGKLTLEEKLPLSCDLPYDHIESQTSKIYKNTVAEACGLEVGERILQFQPAAPESKKIAKLKSSQFKSKPTISASAAQARLKKIPTCPEKVLDAPGLIDDFYLNLLSWSSENVLAIALENAVYCWNASTGSVNLAAECESIVTSIRWSQDGVYLSIGLDDGSIEIWNYEINEKLRTMTGHDSRVSAHCWNDHIITSGSRSGQIFHHDVRVANHITATLNNHVAEVCGIEWRADGTQFASGGNDNIVNIWDARASIPQFTKTAHTAAVKALAWSPTQTSLLATGGGSSCRKIHFWNTTTGARVNTIETESQVSSLKWGYSQGIGSEISATHGFPNNDITVYSYPTLQKTGVIMNAHESRVLNSCLSPDGTTLATLAADENLKFWKLFDVREQEDDFFIPGHARGGSKSVEDLMLTLR